MINSYDLQYFLKVSQTLNLREAAKELGVSQPALSHSLKRMEVEVGYSLFLRRKSGLALTSEGRLFLSKAKMVFSQLNDLGSLFEKDYNSKFTLTLGIHPGVAIYMMEHLLNTQNIKIEYKLGLSREVTEMVHQGFIDCALAINPTPHPELILRPILEDQFGVWKVKGANPNIVFYDPRLFQTQELIRELSKKKFNFEKMIEINDLNLLAQMCSEGLGIGILPARILRKKTSNFHAFSDKIKSLTDHLFLIYALEKKEHPGLKILKDHLLSVVTNYKIK